MTFAICLDDSIHNGAKVREYILTFIKKFAWIPIMGILIGITIPSKEDMKFIIAGTGLIEVSKTDTAQRMASKSVQVVEQYIDFILKDEQKEAPKEEKK